MEQPLPVGGACLLGSINLTQFINKDFNNWDYDKLEDHLPNVVRMLDNVIDLTYLPLPEQYKEIQNKRRIGIGVTGLGSALMMMKIQYGSDLANKLVEEYFKFSTNKLYQISAKISEEKGCFSFWNYDNFLKSDFINCLSQETLDLIKENGLRNSHLTSIQPTGNTGILANNISGGLEPLFMPEYIRTHGVDVLPENLPEHTSWKDTFKEGDVEFKTYLLDGIKYKWNIVSGYTKESIVEDYAVKYLKSINEWDPTAEWAKTTEQLNVSEHLEPMKIISKYIDAAMSKTINLPNDYPYEDFKNLYLECWETGTIKGITTYRTGTMSAVLKGINETPKFDNVRPEKLDCKVLRFKNEDKKNWISFVGIYNDKAYEIFTGINDLDELPIPSYIEEGMIVKVVLPEGSRYDFSYIDKYGYVNTVGGLNRVFNKEYWNYARFVSALLRQETPIEQVIKVVDGLTFTNKGMNSFQAGLIRSMKVFVPDGTKAHGAECENCGSHNIIYEGGCMLCRDCGGSHCG